MCVFIPGCSLGLSIVQQALLITHTRVVEDGFLISCVNLLSSVYQVVASLHDFISTDVTPAPTATLGTW